MYVSEDLMEAPTVSSNSSSSCRGLVARLAVSHSSGNSRGAYARSNWNQRALLLKASVASREHNDMLLDRSAEP